MQSENLNVAGEPVNDNQGSSPKTDSIRKLIPILLSIAILLVVVLLFIVFTRRRQFAAEEAEAAMIANMVGIDNVSEFSAYQGQEGGLYRNLSNLPALDHKILIQRQLAQVVPVSENGLPSNTGIIGMLYIGDPFTQGEITTLSDYLESNAEVNPSVRLIDGAASGQDTRDWLNTNFPWEALQAKFESQEVSSKQISVIWINLSMISYTGEFSRDVQAQADAMQGIIKIALSKFPSTKVVYLSSPRYAGFSNNEDYFEPAAYEAGFAIREVIARQELGVLKFTEGIPNLTTEPALIWGPYLWTNSTTGEVDFGYSRENYTNDGLIFAPTGKQKYVVDLFEFWREYEYSKGWFEKK